MSESNENDFDISQALAELAKGEMAADALEQHLSAIESKVEELLAGAGAGALEPESAQENSTNDQNQLQNGEAEKK